MRPFVFGIAALACVAAKVHAAPLEPSPLVQTARPIHDPWQVSWMPAAQSPPSLPRDVSFAIPATVSLPNVSQQGDDEQPVHAAAIEYSDSYQLRAKIHKYASFATLPLFAVQLALGESLYNPTPTTTTTATGTTTTYASGGSKAGAHAVVGAGIVGLFAVNTVTGAWNLFGEGWSNKEGRPRRIAHGLLMMAADVGFLATSASGPSTGGRQGSLNFTTNEATHRDLAFGSMGVATVGYLLMLLH